MTIKNSDCEGCYRGECFVQLASGSMSHYATVDHTVAEIVEKINVKVAYFRDDCGNHRCYKFFKISVQILFNKKFKLFQDIRVINGHNHNRTFSSQNTLKICSYYERKCVTTPTPTPTAPSPYPTCHPTFRVNVYIQLNGIV